LKEQLQILITAQWLFSKWSINRNIINQNMWHTILNNIGAAADLIDVSFVSMIH